MLLGDFTGPGKLAELEYLRLTHRIGCFFEESAGPDALLNGLNAELLRSQTSIDFMTAVAVQVDLESKKISHSLAGHLPPLHRRWGRRRWKTLPGQGIPLGIRARETYPSHEMRLEPGDKILLISDGFLKMRGSLGGITDPDLAIGCIDDLPPDAAPHEILEGIDDIVRNVTGNDVVADEITSMLIQI
jgi:serine phosphatase RsbU (regulator of sigma subunit)